MMISNGYLFGYLRCDLSKCVLFVAMSLLILSCGEKQALHDKFVNMSYEGDLVNIDGVEFGYDDIDMIINEVLEKYSRDPYVDKILVNMKCSNETKLHIIESEINVFLANDVDSIVINNLRVHHPREMRSSYLDLVEKREVLNSEFNKDVINDSAVSIVEASLERELLVADLLMFHRNMGASRLLCLRPFRSDASILWLYKYSDRK